MSIICYDFQKWTMISLASAAIGHYRKLTDITMLSIAYQIISDRVIGKLNYAHHTK